MSIMQEEQSCFIISQYIEISDSDETIDPTDIAQEISDSDETIDPTDIAQEVPVSKRKNPTVDDDVQTKSSSDSIVFGPRRKDRLVQGKDSTSESTSCIPGTHPKGKVYPSMRKHQFPPLKDDEPSNALLPLEEMDNLERVNAWVQSQNVQEDSSDGNQTVQPLQVDRVPGCRPAVQADMFKFNLSSDSSGDLNFGSVGSSEF